MEECMHTHPRTHAGIFQPGNVRWATFQFTKFTLFWLLYAVDIAEVHL